MPLHINLLHEAQEQELQRKRDPVKIGVMFMLFSAVILVGYYLQQMSGLSSMKNKQSQLQAEWEKLEPLSEEAAAEQARLEGIISSSDALVSYAGERFYMAPVLSSITHMVPSTIQVRSLGFTYTESNNRLEGSIQGVAAAADARSHADQFREALTEALHVHLHEVTLSIASLEDEPEPVVYGGQDLRAVRFNLEIRATVTEPTPMPTPTPVARGR